ncbi:hypothetical protein J7L67_05860, partial [bacterium]|nr:hypothetical protein [bacterium]
NIIFSQGYINMMKEIIEKLLEAEKQAKQIINAANQEARQISEETEKKISKIRIEEIEKAKISAKKSVDQMENDVTQEKIKQLRETEKKIGNIIAVKKKQVPDLMKKIIDMVVTVKL